MKIHPSHHVCSVNHRTTHGDGWRVEVTELQVDRRQHNNLPRWTRAKVNKGRGRGEGKMANVSWRCHKRQHSNQSGQTRGKREVELLAQREEAGRQEAVVLTRGWEAEAVQ